MAMSTYTDSSREQSTTSRLVSNLKLAIVHAKEQYAQHKSERRQRKEDQDQQKAERKEIKRERKELSLHNKHGEFRQKFLALPAELQRQIIGMVVQSKDDVDLAYPSKQMSKVTPLFPFTNGFYHEASAQFANVNTFHITLEDLSRASKSIVPTLRHLSIRMKIVVDAKPHFTKHDVMKLKSISSKFPRLESITFDVSNLGEAAERTFCVCLGTARPVKECRECMFSEQIEKTYAILNIIRNIDFPPWRRYLTVTKKVIFTQRQHDVYGPGEIVHLQDIGPYMRNGDTERYLVFLYTLSDAARVEVSMPQKRLAIKSVE